MVLVLMNCMHFASHCFKRMWQYESLMINYLLLVKGVALRLKAVLNDASSLLDFYYSIGSLVLIKVLVLIFLEWIFQFWYYWFFLNIWLNFLLVLHTHPPDFEHMLYPIFMGGGNAIWVRFHWLLDWNFNSSIYKKNLWEISPVPFKFPLLCCNHYIL